MLTENFAAGNGAWNVRRTAKLAAVVALVLAGAACTEMGKSAATKNGCGTPDSAGADGAGREGLGVGDLADEAADAAGHYGASRAKWYDNGSLAGSSGSRGWCSVVMDSIAAQFPTEDWLSGPVVADGSAWSVLDIEKPGAAGVTEMTQTANVVAVPETVAAPVETPAAVVVESAAAAPMAAATAVVVTEEEVKSPMPLGAPVAVVAMVPAEVEDHSPIWRMHDEREAVETATTPAVAAVHTPVTVSVAPPSPRVVLAPPTSGVSMRSTTGGAAARNVALLLEIAMIISILSTVAFALFFSPVTDQAGQRRRGFTLPTCFALCLGGAVTLLLGACWLGSASMATIAGDSSLADQVRLVVVALAGIALAVAAGMWFSKALMTPMSQVMNSLQAGATGDFQRAPVNSMARNELGELARAADRLQASVKDAMTEVSISSLDLAAAAGEIVAGTREASNSVSEVATRCAQTASSAVEASRVADQGGQAMNQTAAAFRSIDESVQAGARSVATVDRRGREIATIVGVIDDIADRTHLAALNASIEAAKAGPQGKAFALLAEEVRRLAERAQVATEEVARAVNSIQEESLAATQQIATGAAQIRQTAEITTRAGHDLNRMVQTSAGVSGAIQSISAAAEDAGAGAAQAATAADQLSAKADDLKSVVGRFRLDTGRLMQYAGGSRVAAAGTH